MSHWVEMRTHFTDIETLSDACAMLGLNLIHRSTARGWGGNDISADYVIRLEGYYDVAFIQNDNRWNIHADWYDGSVERAIGEDGNKLKQAYTAAAAVKAAEAQGHAVEMQRMDNGDIRLVLKVGAGDL